MQINEKLLTINSYSRPGTKIEVIKKIVVHWVGNAGSTGIANRNYFESLKDKHTYASSHYIVGLDGEIILCVPETEVAYHGNNSNSYSIGIENCHPDWNGKFNPKTTESLTELLATLCKKYSLNPLEDIIRHYDVTKKICPKYYVENPNAWSALKVDVNNKLKGQNEDIELAKAVQTLVLKNIIGNPAAWSSVDKINLKNVPALLKKMGGIDRLLKNKIISNGLLWTSGHYTTAHVRSLIIKYSILG